jgi:hypothetical protein
VRADHLQPGVPAEDAADGEPRERDRRLERKAERDRERVPAPAELLEAGGVVRVEEERQPCCLERVPERLERRIVELAAAEAAAVDQPVEAGGGGDLADGLRGNPGVVLREHAEADDAPAGRLLEPGEPGVRGAGELLRARAGKRVEPRVAERGDGLRDPDVGHEGELRLDLPPVGPHRAPVLAREDDEALLAGLADDVRRVRPPQRIQVEARVEVRVDVDERAQPGSRLRARS